MLISIIISWGVAVVSVSSGPTPPGNINIMQSNKIVNFDYNNIYNIHLFPKDFFTQQLPISQSLKSQNKTYDSIKAFSFSFLPGGTATHRDAPRAIISSHDLQNFVWRTQNDPFISKMNPEIQKDTTNNIQISSQIPKWNIWFIVFIYIL